LLSLDISPVVFTNSIASPVGSSTYLAAGISTQLVTAIRSPITFEIYMNRVGGNTTTIIPVHPEVYYVYPNGGTNILGDWEVANQTITGPTPTRYTFTVAFAEPVLTGAVYVVGKLKTGTVSGLAAGLNIYGGDGYPSHMHIESVRQGEMVSATDLANATNGCVQVSGDTMTGNLIGETQVVYSVQARDSSGLQLKSGAGTPCVTLGAGGGCQATFSDGATFGGLVQPASLTVTGKTTLAGVNISGPQTNTGNLVMSGGNIALGTNCLSGDGGAEGVFVAADGKVGVGTNVPRATAHINGSVLIEGVQTNAGTLTANSGITISGGAVTMTNSTTFFDGKVGGTNAIGFSPNNGTNYWILLP
jgi:hypothetical protein